MSQCLSERTLLLVHEGDGSASDRTHLRACLRCAAHYQRLVQDLQVIGEALRGAPPLPAVVRRPPILRRRTAAVVAALAAMVMFAGVEAWMWRESVLWVSPKPSGDDTETLAFLEEVSRTLSSTGDASGVATVMLTPAPDLTDVAGVPEVEWSDESE